MQAWGFRFRAILFGTRSARMAALMVGGWGFTSETSPSLSCLESGGKNARTLKPGRTQVNYMSSRKREHSRKPDEQYEVIEACSPGPFLELFARGERKNWVNWGNQADDSYTPTWKTYANHSRQRIARFGGLERLISLVPALHLPVYEKSKEFDPRQIVRLLASSLRYISGVMPTMRTGQPAISACIHAMSSFPIHVRAGAIFFS